MILYDGAVDIGIASNNLKPSHSGKIYPVQFRAFFYVNKRLKLLAVDLNKYPTCQIFPVQRAHFPIETGHIAQWVHLFLMNFEDFRPYTLVFFFLSLMVT